MEPQCLIKYVTLKGNQLCITTCANHLCKGSKAHQMREKGDAGHSFISIHLNNLFFLTHSFQETPSCLTSNRSNSK